MPHKDESDATIDAICERAHRATVAELVERTGLPERAVDEAVRKATERFVTEDARLLVEGDGVGGQPPCGLMPRRGQ